MAVAAAAEYPRPRRGVAATRLRGPSPQVRAGANVAGPDDEIAPRTAVGTTVDGRLLSLVVDGCEPSKHCRFDLGMTPIEFGDRLVAEGAYHAINLDGGGSSTVAIDGHVVNHPTNTDDWLLKQERGVTNIVCVG